MSSDSESLDSSDEEEPALVSLEEEELEDSTKCIQSAAAKSNERDDEQKQDTLVENDKGKDENEVVAVDMEERKKPESETIQRNASAEGTKQKSWADSAQLVERTMDPTTIGRILSKRFMWDDGMRSFGPGTIFWLNEYDKDPAWPAWCLNDTEFENRVEHKYKSYNKFEYLDVLRDPRKMRLYVLSTLCGRCFMKVLHPYAAKMIWCSELPESSEAIQFVPLKVLQCYLMDEERRPQGLPIEQLEHGLECFTFGQLQKSNSKKPSYGKMFELAYNYRSPVRSLKYRKERLSDSQFHNRIKHCTERRYKQWVDSLLYAEFIWYETEKRRHQGRGKVVEFSENDRSRVFVEENGVNREYILGIGELIPISDGKSNESEQSENGSSCTATGDGVSGSERPVKRPRTKSTGAD